MLNNRTVAAALLSATLALPAMAQFQKPEDAIKYRQSALTLLAAHNGRVAAMANGRVPFDAKVAAENAALVETLSKLPWAAFGPGTDKGDTRALPAIWAEPAKWQQAITRFQTDAIALNTAAKTGDLEAIKKASGALGQSCKACHDSFRGR